MASTDDSTAKNIYNVAVTINVKRTKEEVAFASKETDKLHELIKQGGQESQWAKARIESVHEMIFLPSADKISNDISTALSQREPKKAN